MVKSSPPRCSTFLCGGKAVWKQEERSDFAPERFKPDRRIEVRKCQTCFVRNKCSNQFRSMRWEAWTKIEEVESTG